MNTHHEDVGDGIQDDEDSFAVLGGEKIQKRLEHVGLNQVDHLLNRAPAGEVGHRPHGLLLSFVVALRKSRKGQPDARHQKFLTERRNATTHLHQCLDQVRNETRVDDLLDLGVPPCGDVGQSPRCLLLDVGLFVAQQSGEHGQSPRVQDGLSLLVRPGDDVADGAKRRSLKEE